MTERVIASRPARLRRTSSPPVTITPTISTPRRSGPCWRRNPDARNSSSPRRIASFREPPPRPHRRSPASASMAGETKHVVCDHFKITRRARRAPHERAGRIRRAAQIPRLHRFECRAEWTHLSLRRHLALRRHGGLRSRASAVDLALLPINGDRPERRVAGNLDGREAATLAKAIGAGVVIPCHYDMFEFNTASPEEFVRTAQELRQPCRVLRAGERWNNE